MPGLNPRVKLSMAVYPSTGASRAGHRLGTSHWLTPSNPVDSDEAARLDFALAKGVAATEVSMRKQLLVGSLVFVLLAGGPVNGAEFGSPKAAVPDELADAWERMHRALTEWGGRMRERFGGRESREDRPLITLMLNNKERLGLSADQVKKLEQLRDNFQKQSIRHDADLRIVELDLAALLDHDPVEMGKVEAKVREAEKLRADLRIARIRAIEQAKGVLNAEQKKKLQELSLESRPPRPAREGINPPAKE